MPNPTMTTQRPLRDKTTAILIVALAIVTACSRGPSESQMLPEKNLVYPGATETRRSFTEEDFGRTVDGNPNNRPAQLNIQYRVAGPLDMETVQSWYREQLSQLGWTYRDDGPNSKSSALAMTTQRDGYEHKYIVDSPGSDVLAVRYFLTKSR